MTKINLTTSSKPIHKFAQEMVAEWAASGQITLRPSEKEKLKNLVASAIPLFLAKNKSAALENYIAAVKEQQLNSCVKAVADVGELFCGVINKQRAIQACADAKIHSERQFALEDILEAEST